MTKVKFEDVKIYTNATESIEFCYAYMVLNDRTIPVQLQKASNGEWVAIRLSDHKLYLLTTTNNVTMEDWFTNNEADIYDSVAKQIEFSR